jgi:small subunit ribosomal protein S6
MFLIKYESVALVSPESGDEGVQKTLGRMREAIEKTGGKEVRLEDWGVRRLTYELNKHKRAHYIYLQYLGANDTVAELERLLGITEAVIKYQTIHLEDRIDPASFDFDKEKRNVTELGKRAKAKVEARREVHA